MPQSVKSAKAVQARWLSWLGCHFVNHTKKVVGSISSQGTNTGCGMNLLWDTVQIGGKSYILASKTESFPRMRHSPLSGVPPFPIMHSSSILSWIWKVCSCLLLLKVNKIPSCSDERVTDSKFNWKNSHKFFLVASLHYFKKTDHPWNHTIIKMHLLVFPIHKQVPLLLPTALKLIRMS